MTGRNKVKLQLIANEYMRKKTFNKRKKSLMKKASELSTLCGIGTCAIVLSPYDSKPEVWPSASGVQRVVSRFQKMPEMEQRKKMVNQESFMMERIFKGKEKLKRKIRDNYVMEMTQFMFQCLEAGKLVYNISTADLNFLEWLVDRNLSRISKRIEALESSHGLSQAQVAASTEADETGKGKEEEVESMESQEWFRDLINY
ncbi:hypothetical protein L6164_020850 [Bauhinia variegata]|uniref:Uncharacterized protein n=1 Tax=Bauhinia variegata TaxID=167791 RepID=A0ACB9MWQ3_BAUVA|nr:hypothetical protein L6164_020850 [Bauhinia variegata]